MFEQNTKQELTPRQKEILSLLRKGLTNAEICRTLGISANTVKVHLANIYKILEVTNRIEAVSTQEEPNVDIDDIKKDLIVVFNKENDLTATPKAHELYLAVVESFHQYHIFRIIDIPEKGLVPGFIISVSSSRDNEDTLFVSIRQGASNELLWTTSIKVNDEDIILLAQKATMLLFRSLVLATAKMRFNRNSPIPYWWYASMYCNVKLENRHKESFEISKKMLSPLASNDYYNEQVVYILSMAYYIAFLENWGDRQENSALLGELARKAMFNAPYSIYSKMIMAFYNTTIGNKAEAIAYLKQTIEETPLFITARVDLIQIYLLTGEEDKALKLIEECERLIPETANKASVYHARSLILFLQGKYDECKNQANQVLLYTPNAMAVRLIMIACCNKTGELEESAKQIKKLYEYHPSFCRNDLEQLLMGVPPQKKEFIINSVQNVFRNNTVLTQN
jgi:DNA-binding CsgD family transcriptional regulator/tetratricopeptide (TPR) repeat protein